MLSPDVRSRIEDLLKKNRVVLFMKGNKHFPQCGFSAQVIKILGETGVSFDTVNVLQDASIRDGIKAFADWPTIPQLYVNGEFVGGCDIVKDLHAQGELSKLLGVEQAPVKAPTLTITDIAKKALLDADDGSGDKLRIEISAEFRYDLAFGPPEPNDVTTVANGITVHLDRASAGRADGVSIDFVTTSAGAAFKIENPNEPASVRATNPAEVKKWLDAGEKFELIDVRGENERVLAKIAQAQPMDAAREAQLRGLPKSAKIVFHCHHGGRSKRAAESFVAEGFTNVYNLEGGIEAWSATVDSTVPRY